MIKFLKSNIVFISILLLGAFFRFWKISLLPGGLFPDEAANGLDVNSILHGQLQPFYERGNGREALFFYFLAVSVALFGRGPWQHHIVSAGFGVLAVLAAYFLAKAMFGKRTAILASLFMAVSSYAVTLSRTAFRANTVPLFSTLTLLLIIKIYQDRDERERYKAAALAGISFALGFYTYISYRMMIPLLIAFKVSLLLAFRDRVREIFHEYLKPKIIAAVAFLITIFPLAYYFITHPGSFMGRAGHVSIFSKDLNNGDVIGTFLEVFRMTMLGFFTTGDANWRHNISEFPFLTSVISPFFAISLIIFTFAGIKFLWDAIRKQFDEK